MPDSVISAALVTGAIVAFLLLAVRTFPALRPVGDDEYEAARSVAYQEWDRRWTVLGNQAECEQALRRMHELEAWAEMQAEPTRSAYLYWAGWFKARQREQIERRIADKRREPFARVTPRPPF